MERLSAAATLRLWEDAAQRDPVERAVVLARAAGRPVAEAVEVGSLPIGQRDARLIALHVALAGPVLEALVPCADCAGTAEVSVSAEALLSAADRAVPVAGLQVGPYAIEWRSPDSSDVAAAASAPDAAAAERVLLERCVTSASGPDGPIDGPSLSPDARVALAAAMAAADPLAEIQIEASCPTCGRAFAADIDIGDYVYTELAAHARRILRDIHVLARSYGWNEAEVLALSEHRRAAYLELASSIVA